MATIGYGYGSEWHLLQYLGRRREVFTRRIEALTEVSPIHWQDHRETDTSNGAPKVRELVGLEFMSLLKQVWVGMAPVRCRPSQKNPRVRGLCFAP